MDKQLRDQLGQAVYNARCMRPGMVGISWLEMSEEAKEVYRLMGEAAVSAFLDPLMPTLQQVTVHLFTIPALKETLEPLRVQLEEYAGVNLHLG